MSKPAVAEADIVIFGGGVAGLWLLNRVRKAGFSALLFESGSLGGGQTHKAQGIIHGGMKYALQGVFTRDAQAMADMPTCWKQCLAGNGELDLSDVDVLSPQHYLWSPNKFAAKINGFLASSALTSKVKALKRENYPAIFQDKAFKGEVYELDEIVIDVHGLVRELMKTNQDVVFKIEPLAEDALQLDDEGNLVSATVCMAGKSVCVKAQQFVFTAGSGNEVVVKKLKQPDLNMQRRPLHMVLAKTSFRFPLYAHCLGLGSRPRITITTHYLHDGSPVWYIGGTVAEEGVGRNREEQIKAARKELETLFPWLDFSDTEFATFMVDRAEPLQKNGFKPETSYSKSIQNMIVAWPTKLALAPKLADEIMQYIINAQVVPQMFDTRELRSWPMPPIAHPIWEDLFCNNDH